MYEIEPHTWMVLGVNSAAEKMHLMMPGEEQLPLVGRPLTDFVPPHMRADTMKMLEEVLREGTGAVDWISARARFSSTSIRPSSHTATNISFS